MNYPAYKSNGKSKVKTIVRAKKTYVNETTGKIAVLFEEEDIHGYVQPTLLHFRAEELWRYALRKVGRIMLSAFSDSAN